MIDVVAAINDTEWLVALLRRLLEPSITKDPGAVDEALSVCAARKHKMEDKMLQKSKNVCTLLGTFPLSL